ncbi:hypothetical protein KEM55_001882 [Ascosphaera atra]|nr:hypothetical protein KEM55_001882 [Ascosphaera atra]
MPNNGKQMNNFTTLIKRLEAATSRLEDMASTLEGTTSHDVSSPAHKPNASPSQESPQQAPGKPSTASPAQAPSPAAQGVPKTIHEFDELINNEVKAFVEAAEKLGEPVAEQSKAIKRAFEAERTYLYVAAKARKPDTQPPELLADLRNASEEINNIRENNRPSPLFNHLSAVAEGVMCLGWFFESKPVDFIKEALGSSQFYGNRVLKDYKEK